MQNVCTFDFIRRKIFYFFEADGYEAAKIVADQASIIAIYNWRGSPDLRKFMYFLIEFDGRKPDWIPRSNDLDA